MLVYQINAESNYHFKFYFMSKSQLDWKIFNLTKDWDILDWKAFRSRNNYWETKDMYYKNKQKERFKVFKYNCLLYYLHN
jgi:hypothetical protein